MMKNIRRFVCMFMVIVTCVCCFTPMTALAAELENEPFEVEAPFTIEPRGGVETLPLGEYLISSSFTITDYNYTPRKTVQGRYLQLKFNAFLYNTTDPLAVRIKIRDYNTREFIGSQETIIFLGSNMISNSFTSEKYDLEYAGREVQIYTEFSSANPGDTVQFTNYRSIVSNQ